MSSELMVMADLSMNRRSGIGREGLPTGSQRRNLRIDRADGRDQTVGQPDQVESLRVVARGKGPCRLRDDGNAALQARMHSDIGFQIVGEIAQRIRGDVRRQAGGRLMIERRVRSRKAPKVGLKWTWLKWT